MWNTSANQPSRSCLISEALKVLENVVHEIEEFDMRRSEVFNALAYLESHSIRGLGFQLYREGLSKGDLSCIQNGLQLIKKHLGFE